MYNKSSNYQLTNLQPLLNNKGIKIALFITSLVFLFLTYLMPGDLLAQTRQPIPGNKSVITTGKNQDQASSRKVRKAQAKSDETREKGEKAYENAKARDMKHRMDIQTPETRKRMKENRKLAEKNNNHYHRSLWQKIFGGT